MIDFYFFSEEPFLYADPKIPIKVDYETISIDMLKIDFKFFSSDPIKCEWFYVSGSSAKVLNDDNEKYIHQFYQVSIFGYEGFLNINPYTKDDSGDYMVVITHLTDPKRSIELSAKAIMPSNLIFV